MNKAITVLTLTKGRPNLVRRCIRSVSEQDYEGEVRHLILIDDCPDTYGTLQQVEEPSDKVRWVLRSRSSEERSGPEHLARLRNLLVRMAETEWITFLDDDNEYEPYHLRLLMECAHQTGSPAVHSWLKLLHFDSTPYLKPRWPWCREDESGKQRYQEMAQRGVVSPGSNVVRDSIHNLPYRCVDTSEWLLKREILLKHPIPARFSYEEYINNKAEDDKLLMQLLAAKVPIVCNEVASLRYYLGGYSNNHDGRYSHSQTWTWHRSENKSASHQPTNRLWRNPPTHQPTSRQRAERILMEQQNELREEVNALLQEIKSTPSPFKRFKRHDRLWYLLLTARRSPERLAEIENCYQDVTKAYRLDQDSIDQDQSIASATKPSPLLDSFARYEAAVQRGIEASQTASLRDMVILLAKKQQDVHAVLKEQMRFVDSLLRKHGISYWAASGTLIGAIRHQAIIPWDGDLDLEMTEADFQRFLTLKDVLHKEAGLSIREVKPCSYKLAYNFDIFADDRRKPPSEGGENLFPYKDEIFPLREFQFYDFKVYGPNKAEQYLKREYGDDCLSTCRIWNYFVNNYWSRHFDPNKYVLTLQEVNEILKEINFDKSVSS